MRMREIGIITCVCSRVRPRIHSICPARGFLSESGSYFSSPRLIALISSGWPRPHLFLKNIKPVLHHSVPVKGFFKLVVLVLVCSLVRPMMHHRSSRPQGSFEALHRYPFFPSLLSRNPNFLRDANAVYVSRAGTNERTNDGEVTSTRVMKSA